jgi:WD40 repeat protein
MMLFSPDGTQLATTGWGDKSIHLWDAATGESLGDLTAHATGMESIDWSADGRFLVSSDRNNGGELIVWNVAEQKALTQLITPQMRDKFGRCDFCKFSPDGRLIVARVKLGVIHFWNAATFKPLGTMQVNAEHINTACSNLFFTADGRHIVTANANGTLSVLRIPATILAGGSDSITR